jgi:signal transduction histidine kinase
VSVASGSTEFGLTETRWGRSPSSGDMLALRVVATVRVAAAIVIAAIGSYLAQSHGHRAALLLVIGLVGVPWATVVMLNSDSTDNRIARFGGPIGDVLALFAVQALVPSAAETVLLGYLVVVAFAAYTAGRAFATLVVVGAVAAALGGNIVTPSSTHLHTAAVVPFLIALVALLVLVDRTRLLQARATTTSARLQTRADTIVAHVADAVVVTDAAGSVLQCNAAAERVIGPAGRPGSLHCNDFLGLHVGERTLDCTSGCALLRERVEGDFGLEVWRRTSDDRRQPLLADAAEVVGADGRSEVVHSIRDITRIKQAEEAKTLFLATASHELKTPLTVITGFASTLIRYGDLDDRIRSDALHAIHSRAQELTRIVDRLLLSSRIEAGRLDVTLEDVDVVPLLRERARAFGAAMARTVDVEAAADLPAVRANANAVITVVDHLMDNAAKYSPGGERVVVRAMADDESVRIQVVDGGIGMDAEQAEHCFERFWQAEATDVRRFGGTGIGLYIVQSMVEAMGGTITVESAKGAGSTFTVTLPTAAAARLGIPTQSAKSPDVGESTSIREFMRQIGVPERTRR